MSGIVLSIISVVMLNVIMQNVIMMNVIRLCDVTLNDIIQSAAMCHGTEYTTLDRSTHRGYKLERSV
jgi:hypothetical protein